MKDVSYRSPWGTSCPANIQLELQRILEDDRVFMVQVRGERCPMFWDDLRLRNQRDQRAMYHFIKNPEHARVQALADLSPSIEPKPLYIWIVPH